MEKILEVKKLRKKFEQTTVLKDVDLSIDKREFVVIMGRSGSGKSTLLYNMSGMDQATSGEVFFEGKEITHLSDEALSEIRLNKMGFVFQQSQLLKKLSIKDNIILPGYKAKKVSREDVNKKAMALMNEVGITEIADHDIKKVSGGQLQRAAICRALINEPDILFGDELTGALNLDATREVMEIMARINKRGTTIVLVTHDVKVAAWASRVIFISDGQIEAEIKMDQAKKALSISQREGMLKEWLSGLGF